MKASKSITRVLSTIEVLKAKEAKTSFDFVRLANAELKIEDKSASKVYKVVTSSPYAKDILGKSKVPSFNKFTGKLANKPYYSNYDGFMALRKFNKVAIAATKVARQNAATKAK